MIVESEARLHGGNAPLWQVDCRPCAGFHPSMYPSLRDRPNYLDEQSPPPLLARWTGVSETVICLGLTSLFTDISSEMITAILPLYLTMALQFSPLQFGLVDGLIQAMSAATRLAGGFVSDRWRCHKATAAVGYGLSALCKLGLFGAGSAWLSNVTFLLLDRIGKGIRTAPRDALISLSSPTGNLGRAFGVHRALDTLGAFLGPIFSFALLAFIPGGYDAVFVCSFAVAVIGLGILICFVENPPAATSGLARPERVTLGEVAGFLRQRDFLNILGAGILLGSFSISDGFIYLMVQRSADLNVGVFPLLFVGTALVYLLLAVPAGRAADRFGRAGIFLAGHLLLIALYAVLLLGRDHSGWQVVLCLTLLGSYYAMTDGVLTAIAAVNIPVRFRTSGLALLTTATTLARLVAAAGFGALWSWRGPNAALICFVVGMTIALPLARLMLAKNSLDSKEPNG